MKNGDAAKSSISAGGNSAAIETIADYLCWFFLHHVKFLSRANASLTTAYFINRFRLDLFINDRSEHLAPENGPLFLFFVQGAASVLICGGHLNSAKTAACCQLGENGIFEDGLEGSFDDYQLLTADKLFFALLGFVFSPGGDQMGQIPADA